MPLTTVSYCPQHARRTTIKRPPCGQRGRPAMLSAYLSLGDYMFYYSVSLHVPNRNPNVSRRSTRRRFTSLGMPTLLAGLT